MLDERRAQRRMAPQHALIRIVASAFSTPCIERSMKDVEQVLVPHSAKGPLTRSSSQLRKDVTTSA